MRARSTERLNYDDVNFAVQKLLDDGIPLTDITARMIYQVLNERGSFTTILKYFEIIKKRLDGGEAIDGTELSDIDVQELRTLVGSIIERRTLVVRTEKDANAQAMSDAIWRFEVEKSELYENNTLLVREVVVLEDDISAQATEIDSLKAQVVHLQGMVEALTGTIARLVPAIPAAPTSASVDHMPEAQPPQAAEPVHQPTGQAVMQLSRRDVVETPSETHDENG